MPSNRPKIVIYTDDTTIQKIQYIAEKDRRKTSNYCDLLIQKHIAEFEQEHGEIKIKGENENVF